MHQRTCDVADTICRTTEHGVTITGAAIDNQDRTHIFCEVLNPNPRCPTCEVPGQARDKADRSLTDTPAAGRQVLLHVAIPRFICHTTDCPTTIFRATIEHIAAPRAVTTTRTTRWILRRIAIDKMSVAAVATNVGVTWKIVNRAAANAARTLVYANPSHLGGVRHLGVDEHKWKHVRGHGESRWVTVLIDLTPVVDGTGPARLLDMFPGVAMDGFTGHKTATAEELPTARIVMDPFHVVQLAGEKLGSLPHPDPAGHLWAPRPQGRHSVQDPASPAHSHRATHRQAEGPPVHVADQPR